MIAYPDPAPASEQIDLAGQNQLLLVDDSPLFRHIVQVMLSEMGFYVTTADDGLEGWRTFRQGRFDLVVTDLQMPGLDGWQLADRIKNSHPGIPVVIITGAEPAEVMSEYAHRTLEGIVFKPVNYHALNDVIDSALAGKAVSTAEDLPFGADSRPMC